MIARLLGVLVIAVVALGAVFSAADHATVHATSAQLVSAATDPCGGSQPTPALTAQRTVPVCTSVHDGSVLTAVTAPTSQWAFISDVAISSQSLAVGLVDGSLQGPASPVEHHHLDIDPLPDVEKASAGTTTTAASRVEQDLPVPTACSFPPSPD